MLKLRTLLLYDYIYIILSILIILYSYTYLNIIERHSKYNINDNVVIGYIDKINIDGNKLNISLIGKEKIIISYYFKTKEELFSFNYKLGDYIKVIGNMEIPKEGSVFNLFNYKQYLEYNNIFYIFKAKEINLISKNNKIHYSIKQYLITKMDNINKSSAYVKALVLGDDSEFSQQLEESYQYNGVSHLFAVSGSHIIFLAVILLWLFKQFKIEENKRYFLVILIILFYMFLTNYTGSVIRAVFFFTLLAINKIYYFNVKTTNILQLVLFVSLLFKPSLLYDVGFQFSFIISLYLVINQDLIINNKNYLKQTFIVSLIAFLTSIPICLNNFFSINILSPFINVLFVPFVSLILFPLAFICLVFPFLDNLMYLFISILENISLFISNIKIGELILIKPNLLIILLYYLLITIFILGIKKKKYLLFIPLCLLLLIHYNINYLNKNDYVVFLDVGQGDSIFINLSNKGSILIDTGGKKDYREEWQKGNNNYSIGINTIIPYLKSIGIHKLDYLILTHGDEDHMGESINIVNSFKVDKVIFNNGEYNDLEQELIDLLNKKKIDYLKNINDLNIDKYKLYFLNTDIYDNENDNSNVIYFNYNNIKFLFMGDAGIEKEKDILVKYNLKDIDFMKVGHHGSSTSSSKYFIDTINPKYSIISVGSNNRYGHPKDSVLNMLKNSRIYRTDLDGSIEIKLNKNNYEIRTCSP